MAVIRESRTGRVLFQCASDTLEAILLQDRELMDADLRGSCLAGAVLTNVDLTEANLDRSDAVGIKLVRCQACAAQLTSIDARGASVEDSDFTNAQFS